MTRQALHLSTLRAIRRQSGACPRCGAPSPTICQACRSQDSARKRRKLGMGEWRKGGRGRPPINQKQQTTEIDIG